MMEEVYAGLLMQINQLIEEEESFFLSLKIALRIIQELLFQFFFFFSSPCFS